MKVLIVEDTASARKLLLLTLEHYGCTVVEAVDGVEGFEMAVRHKPDIIISDALMPRMDGFQLLRALKVDPVLKSIPFIFYSSTYTGEKEAELALTLGADAFIAKPTEPEELWKKTCAIMKEWETRQREPAHPTIDDGDEQYLREYSRVVAAKLEEKVRELEESLALRQQAEDELRILNAELTREIAERRNAENALREQELELATIFEDAPFMMLLLDGDQKVRRANGLVCSFTGSSIDDIVDRRSGTALHCLHSHDSSEGCGFGPFCQDCIIRKTIESTFATGQSHHQVETRSHLSVYGKELTIPFLLSTTKVMVGHQAMVLLSLQDISEYKTLEAQLLHTQKMESIGTLAGGIAHDFNNILTVIMGYGSATLSDMKADDPLRQNVELIMKASDRATSLARDLLLFSRKQIISDKENVDLNEMVRSVDKFLRRVIGEDITCLITLAEGKIPVLADTHQLEQVLMNFATNARDAMPNGGSLSIITERITLDEEFIAVHGFGRSGPSALLTVTDSGMGMDDETLRQIFDPFFTTKEVGKGTGLGLSVVYGIVKQHDGLITVDSEPGHGTTLRIYLPLIKSPESGKKIDSKREKPYRGTETILLAEDDETVRAMTGTLLGSFGYEVISAADGDDAVQKFRENMGRIKLLLFDVIMPKKNGKEAYDEIRALDPSINVIFASGYSSDEVHQKLLVSDNTMFISKPYIPSNLMAMVRRMLDRGSN